MKLSDFKQYRKLAKYVGISEKELWGIISGKTAKSIEVAEKIQEVSGIHAKTLMFNPCVRIRPGFLEWFASNCDMTKTEVWHVFRGERSVDDRKAKELERFTGIPARKWQTGEAWMICARTEEGCEGMAS